MSEGGLPKPEARDATLLLNAAANGDTPAAGELMDLVYDQLRRAAQLQMGSERAGHTLGATALVHEAYLRLVGPRDVPWRNRAHFYAAAAESMRRILLDHARARGRRSPVVARPLDLTDIADLANRDSEEIVRFDEAFGRLEAESAEAAAVVRLRFFAGLSVEQTANALGISTSTVDRRWAFARAWLFRRLDERV